MPVDLERFKQAQKSSFVTAMLELRAGGKRSHWIWYVFPQLRGLGSSPQAVRYGLDNTAEAAAYLLDPLLRERYLDALRVVHAQVTEGRIQLYILMGSDIDAKKLVSSATLFEYVAAALAAKETGAAREELAELERLSREVLDAVQPHGYPRCAFTLRQLREKS